MANFNFGCEIGRNINDRNVLKCQYISLVTNMAQIDREGIFDRKNMTFIMQYTAIKAPKVKESRICLI